MQNYIPTWTELEEKVARLEREALERRIANLERTLLYRNATTDAVLAAVRRSFRYPCQRTAQPNE